MLVFVGLPVAQGAKVYDAAAAVCNGELLGVVPASCPGDKHFALPDEDVKEMTKAAQVVWDEEAAKSPAAAALRPTSVENVSSCKSRS